MTKTMENTPGAPGLIMIGVMYMMGFISHITRSDVSFWIGLGVSILAGLYYIVLLIKEIRAYFNRKKPVT